MNLQDCHSLFIEYLKSDGKSQSTLLAYGKDIEQFLELLKSLKINQITELETQHIDAFLTKLEVDKYTPKSISRKLNSIKTFCRILIKKGILTQNPAEPVPHPKVENKTPRVLTEMEYRVLRDVVRNDQRLYTIIELMLQTGIRIGELARLEVNNIDLENKRLYIKQYGSNDARYIPLNNTALTILEKHLESRNSDAEANAVFITKTGRTLLVRNIRASINRAFKKAGIKNATVNDIRNTFIAHNLARGVNLLEVSRIAGHKRISTTEKYLNLIEETKKSETKIEEL